MSSKMDRISANSLAARLRAGDQDAFDEFADYYGARLFSMFRKAGLADAYAEDLAVSCISDILVYKLERYDPNRGSSLDAWVYAIAKNMMIDWFRQNPRSSDIEDTLIQHTSSVALDTTRDGILSYALHEALGLLNPVEQKIIQLRYFDGQHTFKEIGIELEMTTGAVRIRHMRTCRKLANLLAEYPIVQEHLCI